MLLALVMHPLLFSFKRVFLRSAYFTRAFAREFDLTPARYDLLIAIARSPDGIAQKDLRHLIGVTAPVICRMLYRLEELGLVWRHPHPSNRRWRWVRLTPRGATKYTVANSELMGPGSLVDELTHLAVTRDPDSARARRIGFAAATKVTDILRDRLGDCATLAYPFYPAPGETWPSSTPQTARRRPAPRSAPPTPSAPSRA